MLIYEIRIKSSIDIGKSTWREPSVDVKFTPGKSGIKQKTMTSNTFGMTSFWLFMSTSSSFPHINF